MNQPTVVIISDDPEFSGEISSRWQQERGAPAFTLMSGDLCEGLEPDAFDLVIIGSLRNELSLGALRGLERSGKPVVRVSAEGTVSDFEKPRWIVLKYHENWLDTLVLVSSEVLRRCDALARLRRAEQTNTVLERQAALGRYVLDMRHNLNNALTSILGNAELLPASGSLPAQAQSQVETIRNMALRINEILQRFSSLEKELSVAARQNEQESDRKSQAAASW